MKSLRQLALEAVPNPGLMAETFLVPHHPVAIELQERQYTEDCNCFREQHLVNFRYAYEVLLIIEALFSNTQIYPSKCYVFRSIVESLFWIKDCTWLSVKTKCCMIEL